MSHSLASSQVLQSQGYALTMRQACSFRLEELLFGHDPLFLTVKSRPKGDPTNLNDSAQQFRETTVNEVVRLTIHLAFLIHPPCGSGVVPYSLHLLFRDCCVCVCVWEGTLFVWVKGRPHAKHTGLGTKFGFHGGVFFAHRVGRLDCCPLAPGGHRQGLPRHQHRLPLRLPWTRRGDESLLGWIHGKT